jgi:hypothetical protein
LKWTIVGRAGLWVISVLAQNFPPKELYFSALCRKHHFRPKATQMGGTSFFVFLILLHHCHHAAITQLLPQKCGNIHNKLL